MPIPFSSIPEHVRICIVQKQQLSDFLNFHKSSRESYFIAKQIRTKFSVSGNRNLFTDIYFGQGIFISQENKTYQGSSFFNLPVRIETQCVRIFQELTEDFCVSLINFIENTTVCLERIYANVISCSPKSFDRLLCRAEIKSLNVSTNNTIAANLLRIPAIRNLQGLFATSNLEDEDLQRLRMSFMTLRRTQISSYGINSLIKEWLKGRRAINEVEIETLGQFEKEKVFDEVRQHSYYGKRKVERQIEVDLNSTVVKIHKIAFKL